MMIRASGEVAANGNQRVDAAHVGQPQVHQRDVGPVLAELLHGVAAGRRLRDEHHVGLMVTMAAMPSRSRDGRRR